MGRARPCVILWAALALSVLVSACASVQRDVSLPVTDPNEASNRALFGFNQAVLHPPAEVVKALTPGPVHDRLHDLNANLQEPRIFANDLLQLRFDAAVKTAGRFILNSTFGLGGLFDVASAGGLPQQSGDFGQTLFVWGVPEGPYTIRPYYGPATARGRSARPSTRLATLSPGRSARHSVGRPTSASAASMLRLGFPTSRRPRKAPSISTASCARPIIRCVAPT